jgi:hypothetical protein
MLASDILPPACPACRSRAALLLRLLRLGPRTWRELEAAGLGRAAVLLAVGAVVAGGEFRIRVGPLLLELEDGEGPADV